VFRSLPHTRSPADLSRIAEFFVVVTSKIAINWLMLLQKLRFSPVAADRWGIHVMLTACCFRTCLQEPI